MSSEQIKTPEDIIFEEKMNATAVFDQKEGFNAVILDPIKIQENTSAFMRRANAVNYHGKWIVTEHVKGAVFTLYTDGKTYAVADSSRWIVPARTTDNIEKQPSLTYMMNRLFTAAKELYPDIEQLKMHTIMYSKDIDLSSQYRNKEPRRVVWSMESGTANAEGYIVFTPIPFDRVVSFLDKNAFQGKDKTILKSQFVPVPVLATLDSLKEAMEYDFENCTSQLDSNKGGPIHSVIVRPETAWINVAPLKTTKPKPGSARARIEARLVDGEKAKLVTKADPLLIKRRSRAKTMQDMFTYEKLVSAIRD